MAELISLKCQSCNADLSIEDGKDILFCQYCGTKILYNREQVVRHIDEASVKEAETNRMVQLKQLEMQDNQRRADEQNRKTKIVVSITSLIVGLVLIIIGFVAGSASGDPDSGLYSIALVGLLVSMGSGYVLLMDMKEKDNPYDGKVRVPDIVCELEKKNYQIIESALQSAGFTNVKCIPLNDLTLGLLKKPESVANVTIGGNDITCGGKRYPADSIVIITYHSYPPKKKK